MIGRRAPAPPAGCGLGSSILGMQKMGSKGTRLAESERGVWFWLRRHGICTPHLNRKYELTLFLGAENRFCPQTLEPRTWPAMMSRYAMLEPTRKSSCTAMQAYSACERRAPAGTRHTNSRQDEHGFRMQNHEGGEGGTAAPAVSLPAASLVTLEGREGNPL